MSENTFPINSELVIEMAVMFLPKDGTDWRPRCVDAHNELAKCWLVSDAAFVPAKVALEAFERMGRQYRDENREWRGRLGAIAYRHWHLQRGDEEWTFLPRRNEKADEE